ncbi:MinD/ParA family protein [Schumannella sp. 10F1B-5-1]|uniref:MinD/ParA family ATP-binding protein n=1 Tax=Schumannella sp. 10F1B-5-1 TaxID=2590780 RepID=UPI001132990A|nr:AAA family ATPase [Schumannella sp. 10F1B-5-1]TPW73790.1 AAA family ATPase [Schumannella sp. 10F1B-5-1]
MSADRSPRNPGEGSRDDSTDAAAGPAADVDEIEYVGELLEQRDLTLHLPESLTIALPTEPLAGASGEQAAVTAPRSALASDAVAASAVTEYDGVVSAAPAPVPATVGTTSIEVVTPRVVHDPTEESPEVVPLPEAPYSGTRRERLRGEPAHSPEPSSMLTAERLLDPKGSRRIPPEGFWQRLLFETTFHLVNVGDSAKARERKALEARITRRLDGGTRFVPVLTRKGGVGKTTVTTLLGMALADVRDDRVIAIDANPDRGTLSERVPKRTRSTVRDLVNHAPSITDYGELSSHVSRDETRLDVLASDTDPMLSEAFDEDDYNVVADLVARYYSIALTDCGTGIVHSVMRATLQRADSLVIVSGGSVDEARLASETLTWLEANGYGALVRNAVVALNTATHATNLVKLDEIEAHFRSRVREIVRIPYDPELAAGSVVRFRDLKPFTRESARHLAALVVDGLPTQRER